MRSRTRACFRRTHEPKQFVISRAVLLSPAPRNGCLGGGSGLHNPPTPPLPIPALTSPCNATHRNPRRAPTAPGSRCARRTRIEGAVAEFKATAVAWILRTGLFANPLAAFLSIDGDKAGWVSPSCLCYCSWATECYNGVLWR